MHFEIHNMQPIEHLTQWLQNEHSAGAPNPQHAVLSTANRDAVPHCRVVAIREMNDQGLLFFTQRNTKKVAEINMNPFASMTFWFELLSREVIIEGVIEPLTEVENEQYWQNYPREAQIRFHSYAPTSAQPIRDKQELEEKREQIRQQYTNQPVPLSPLYCGFRLKPTRFIFYAYRSDELSDVFEYAYTNNEWIAQVLSP